MLTEIDGFIHYLENVREASKNTVLSYRRDLEQMAEYMEKQGITDLARVTRTSLNSYFLYLESQGKAASTISRITASVKAFFHYQVKEEKLRKDPSELLKAPRVEKKAPAILTVEEVERFLNQPKGENPKELRDKAMLELLYATGIRVSELIGLQMGDLNLQVGYITCRDGQKERAVPFGKTAKHALKNYLDQARSFLVQGEDSSWLFTNCKGMPMSRQGFWKIVKHYGKMAGIHTDITLHVLRHSFAVHLIRGGADLQAVSTLMGHAGIASAQMYKDYLLQETPC